MRILNKTSKNRKKIYLYHKVIHMKEIIEKNYRKQMNIEDLYIASGFSTYRLIRIFKLVFGLPPHQYLLQLKVQSAKQKLINTEFSISEITQSHGFANKEEFVTTFIRFTGQSPTQYRKLHQAISWNKVYQPSLLEKNFSYAGQAAGLLRFQGVFSASSYHWL